MSKITGILIGLFWLTTVAEAQRMELPMSFARLLQEAGVDFLQPADAGYKAIRPFKNPYQESHFAIRSSREDLEIRYFVIPWEMGNDLATNPHVSTFTTLTDVATNSDDAFISAIRPTRAELLKDFNADWGMVYFFTPKEEFSDRKHGRMLSLCKEGQGTVFVFYLFDDPGNEALDTRYFAVRFQ